MRTVHIVKKLEEMGVDLDTIVMGDFDSIGEFTAKRTREPNDPNYRKYGAFYRANYERGILIYNLIRQYNLTSFLEIGFGRGYSAMCAAKAFYDAGVQGKIVSVEPNLDERFIAALTQVFPADMFRHIQILRGPSVEAFVQLKDEKFDLIYIDGDHTYNGTKLDWEASKDRYNKFLLFDDYNKKDVGLECSKLIDEIDDPSKELIIMDRRMFFDDRRFTDEQVEYGQVLLTRPGVARDQW